MRNLGSGGPLAIYRLGSVRYGEALDLQHRLVAARQAGDIGDLLLLLEHPPVITMGRSAVREDVLATPAELSAAGASIEWIERGGETTYHGPGQLVGYPIIDLRAYLRSLKKYVHLLEETFVRHLADYGIAAGRDTEHRGVWVGNEKITAVGVAVQQRVTFHGFAYNVNTDLSHFGWIVPCGITDRGQTSLERLTGRTHPIDRIAGEVAAVFADLFGYSAVESDPSDLDRFGASTGTCTGSTPSR